MLDIQDLHVRFRSAPAGKEAVKGISLHMNAGEILGLVGESGSGKTVTAMALAGLLSNAKVELSGHIFFEGLDLLRASRETVRSMRGKDIAVVFQEPMTSMDPVMRIGPQVEEALLVHTDLGPEERRARALQAMADAELPDPETVYRKYPHELSGGMLQRTMVAAAIISEPKLLICDEPTTALDVTIQAQILDLLRNLKDKINSSIMFITHDLGVIAEMADYVVVMYAGRIVEQGTAEEIFAHPAHPYTIGLMASKPVVGRQVEKLYSIPGKVPNPINMPDYCYFKDRCEMCVEQCSGEYPCEVSISPTHKVSCYRYYDGKRPELEEQVEEEMTGGADNGKEGE